MFLSGLAQAQPDSKDLRTQEDNILSELVAIQASIERLERSIPQLDGDVFLAEE